MAAQALIGSVVYQGIVGVDFDDLRGNLAGAGSVFWAPLPDGDMGRLTDMLANPPPFQARSVMWTVVILPSTCGLDEFTKIGEVINQYCSAEATVIVSLPI